MSTNLATKTAEKCCSCGKTTPLANLHNPGYCDNSFCSACGTYHNAPATLGYLCKSCYTKQTCHASKNN